MSKNKKYLRKNEFRIDLNPEHRGSNGEPHPAYITARIGRKFKANTVTHARIVNGVETLALDENPNKQSKDTRKSRISPPFWQGEKQFSKQKLPNFRFSNRSRKKIRKYNNKFK